MNFDSTFPVVGVSVEGALSVSGFTSQLSETETAEKNAHQKPHCVAILKGFSVPGSQIFGNRQPGSRSNNVSLAQTSGEWRLQHMNRTSGAES